MDCWVLGCGPSLTQVEIPSDAFRIGVNNSYKHIWSPVWCGTDLRALRRDYKVEDALRPLVWLTAIDPAKVNVHPVPGRPLIQIPLAERISLRKGGVFAYWAAVNIFKATRVFLLGFDMETDCRHFDNLEHNINQTYISQRYQMRQIQKASGVESWIWLKNGFHSVTELPTNSIEVKGMQYIGRNERDVTHGMPLPQEFWENLPEDWAERRKAFYEKREEIRRAGGNQNP